ncbi:hypothetical protein [Rhodopirellula sp. P2]|uniref:hypothetical protein n=1 Tax=Rhodopirellula sp. P2 TaxID=2127060 RepID=UPI002368E11F|nr:hypothetical protein [Rhodopirellula sp. P2]WDQ16920.1 hypothetical protein PSR62_25405 [Rhodopirellula sp. P2]
MSLAAVGAIALGMSLACVVTETTQLLLVLSSLSHEMIAWSNGGVALLLFVVTIAYAFPLFSRALGARVRHRFPAWTRRKLRLTNLGAERRFLRVCLIVLAAFPLQTSLAHAVTLRASSDDRLAPLVSPWWFMGLAIAMLVAGGLVHFQLPRLYLKCRHESLLNGLRHYPRGVALRSFIAQWDNPSRNIYLSCRVSRRVASAHRVGILISAACFSAAGCLFARVELPWVLDELATVVAMAGIFSLWPTATRMVDWSGLVLDPLCGDPDEFDEYE